MMGQYMITKEQEGTWSCLPWLAYKGKTHHPVCKYENLKNSRLIHDVRASWQDGGSKEG